MFDVGVACTDFIELLVDESTEDMNVRVIDLWEGFLVASSRCALIAAGRIG